MKLCCLRIRVVAAEAVVVICEMLERSSLQFTEGTALVHDNRRELYTDSGGKIQSQLSLSSLELTVTKVSKKESHQKRKRMKRITLKKTENTTTCIYLFFAASSSTISPCSTDALVLIQLSFFVKTKYIPRDSHNLYYQNNCCSFT